MWIWLDLYRVGDVWLCLTKYSVSNVFGRSEIPSKVVILRVPNRCKAAPQLLLSISDHIRSSEHKEESVKHRFRQHTHTRVLPFCFLFAALLLLQCSPNISLNMTPGSFLHIHLEEWGTLLHRGDQCLSVFLHVLHRECENNCECVIT